jgi:hypothetical protein
MSGLGDAIKYLYSQFILRDVLSFITPGAIVVLTAFLLFLPEPCLTQRLETLFRYSTSIYWLLYIPLFGLFYVTGYALQCIKNLMHCCYSTKKTESLKSKREKEIEFLNVAALTEWATQHRERVVVHKQMCVNNFVAIIIAGIFLIVDAFCPWQYVNITIVSVVIIFLLVSVFCDYRDSVAAQDTIEDKIIELGKKGELKEDSKR